MQRVLFVCLGNICRSPMAEALFRQAISKSGSAIQVDSAATSRWEHGNPIHEGTKEYYKLGVVQQRIWFLGKLRRAILKGTIGLLAWITKTSKICEQ